MDRELLKSYGIDYDKGLKNCMGNLSFYKKIMSMFLQDQCFPQARDAYESGNGRELFSRMHELKGISGNAALTELYDSTLPLVEKLRPGRGRREDVSELFAVSERAYFRACEGIALFLREE